ncbi:MAG: hypothetical protein KatS3mg082_1604 [Nitrospiraceae bacterium]|nr:MAG: hypothetical protein KatS3mg082_1604 [Nitrospiraceae bacterium]
MALAGLFAAVLFLGLIVGDWWLFSSLWPDASRYGCGIARGQDRLNGTNLLQLKDRFNRDGMLILPHGVARFFPEERRLTLRPQCHLFSLRFRTAWPIKGTIDVIPDGETVWLVYTKRIPWSSAILTLLWFGVVGLGTIWFLIAYLMQGGAASLSGLLMGLGVTGLGLLVVAFGIITVAFAYRLENGRLIELYQELRAALEEPSGRAATS